MLTKIKEVDLFIIGGGINGVGIAADAAARGLSVTLCEAQDLASGTSSASTKLIHGGLRYLEQYEFSLVKKALHERETLMKKAPHLISPLEIILPHDKHLRPVWMLRAGLFLYDHLAKLVTLPKSKKLNFKRCKQGGPLKKKYKVGFSYSDCWTDDARLVVANAQAARENGASILTRTKCVKASRVDEAWEITLQEQGANETSTVRAKTLVNAGGPWVSRILNDVVDTQAKHSIKLVKGSHIIVPKMYDGDHAYILQNPDGRIVFAIPYQESFTLIGTTDVNYEGDPRLVVIDDAEKEYLCKSVNTYFENAVNADDIVWSYSGVRPLYDDNAGDPSKVTRDYHFEVEDDQGKAPLVSIFGGKLTTYRVLAESAMSALKPYFPTLNPSTTANTRLPGAEFNASIDEFYKQFTARHSWLPSSLAKRLIKSYGSLAETFVDKASSVSELGENFGADLTEKEVNYLIENEWARSADDILWRRSKLGLYITKDDAARLQAYVHRFLNENT